MSKDKWLILDRDGVINHDSDLFIKSPAEWRPVPGSLEAIAALNTAGYRIVVITNQSGLARGLFTPETLTAIHQKQHTLLAKHGGRIERIYFCPHGPGDHCACRKPLAGLFEQFSDDYTVALDEVYALGDSIRDLQAARSAGARSVLLRSGKGVDSERILQNLAKNDPLKKVPVYNDLASFTEQLLSGAIA